MDELCDELYEEAQRLVVESGDASIVNLQRKLRLNFVRACRLRQEMERRGVVAPAGGVGPRKVKGRQQEPEQAPE